MTIWRARRSYLLGTLLIAWASGTAHAADPVAVGQVTDLRGHAVAGVLVKAETWEHEALGAARSDAQGRFRMPLSRPVKDLTLIVEHPGFQRWALAATSPDEDGSFHVRLTRRIDREYLTELAAQTAPVRFRQLARDLLTPSLGTVGETQPMEQILPFLKALRERLRALLPAKPAQLKHRDLPGEQHNAVLLLAFLGDPRDDALVDAWASKQNFISRPPRPCRGPTPEAAAEAWQKAHFEREGYGASQQVPYNTLDLQIAPSGDHGLALHSVYYAHWGYSQHLVLVRLNNAWKVRRVIDYQRWHKDY
ncbi:MAG TPA: carboxypeptidase-like regulatory domain-containing protein [Thermoanaerobaculia bacterium]